MQLLLCPGYNSCDLTHAFLQSLLAAITPDCLWVLPIWTASGNLPWLLTAKNAPQTRQPLNVIAFSAGVVAAYPLVMAWQSMGGTSRLIAIDGWGMPLPGHLSIYRMSHDHWTHRTTYFPSAAESQGYFYACPGVDHLALWQSPHRAIGRGSMGKVESSMTALEFLYAVLMQG